MSQHLEGLGDKWFPLLADANMIPGVIATTLAEGGTRPVWAIEHGNMQTMLVAWPEVSLLRAAVVVSGEKEKQLDPVTVIPLMEGFPNPLEIVDTYAWNGDFVGEVQAQPNDDAAALWFFDPLFYRDKHVDLTPGVTQVFYLSGLCFGLRRALLDEMTVTAGPNYEEHATTWLSANPGKTRLDVPPLKVSLQGARILGPAGDRCCEYQARVSIYEVDHFMFGPEGAQEKMYRFGATFGTPENPLHLIMYASERICLRGYEPQEGHEVDMIFWMQGRIVDVGDDMDAPRGATGNPGNPDNLATDASTAPTQ